MASAMMKRWFISLGCCSSAAMAATCPAPDAVHPTVQRALDDPGCSVVALPAGAFPESLRIARSVELAGAGSDASVIEGRLEVSGLVHVPLRGFSIANGCALPGLRVLDGATVSAADVDIAPALVPCPALPDVLFRDGFE